MQGEGAQSRETVVRVGEGWAWFREDAHARRIREARWIT